MIKITKYRLEILDIVDTETYDSEEEAEDDKEYYERVNGNTCRIVEID